MSIENKASGVWQVAAGAAPARPKRRNAPRLPPEQRREQLLDAALRVVGREGLGNLTMQAVAKEAGVAKPVLYAIYPTAPELLAALLHREHARGMAQVSEAVPADLNGANPDEAYLDAVMAFLDSVADTPMRWRLILMHSDGAPGDYRELLAAARERVVERFEDLLETGIALRGGPDGADIELIAHVMLGFIEVLGRMVLSDPQRFPPDRLRSSARALIRTLPVDGPRG